MDIGLHGIKKIMVDEAYRVTENIYSRTLHIITDEGRIDVRLYSPRADGLEVVPVAQVRDFYDPETAA